MEEEEGEELESEEEARQKASFSRSCLPRAGKLALAQGGCTATRVGERLLGWLGCFASLGHLCLVIAKSVHASRPIPFPRTRQRRHVIDRRIAERTRLPSPLPHLPPLLSLPPPATALPPLPTSLLYPLPLSGPLPRPTLTLHLHSPFPNAAHTNLLLCVCMWCVRPRRDILRWG